jgi:hypothetical protein
MEGYLHSRPLRNVKGVLAMRRFRSSGGKLWFLLGLAAAGLLMPATVVAAISVVRIQGTGSNVANVDAAHQLLAVENDPATFFVTGYPATNSPNCVVLQTPTSGKAMIVRQLRFFRTDTHFDQSHGFLVFTNSTCTGAIVLIEVQTAGNPSATETFEPGLPVKAGNGLSVEGFGTGLLGEAEATGYLVPSTTVP